MKKIWYIFIMLSIMLLLTFGIFVNNNKYSKTFTQDGVKFAVLVDGSNQTTFPSKGSYTVNINCTNSSYYWNYDEWVAEIYDVTGVVSCNLTFVTKTKAYLNSYIKDTLTGTTQGSGQVVNENGYRYEGTNPNNYILFNGELWRIIGVFDSASHGITNTYLTKIIRNDSIGGWAWDKSNVNEWPSSSLYNLLNTYYYSATNGTSSEYCYQYSTTITGDCNFTNYGIQPNYRSMIQSVTWYLGGYSIASMTADASYGYERGTTVYSGRSTFTTGYIGLMYLSDYGYAVLSTSCARTRDLSSYTLNSTSCAASNWLKKETTEWTLMPRSSYTADVFNINFNGNLDNDSANVGYATRPTLYLKSHTYILSGTGTMADPYIIGYDS